MFLIEELIEKIHETKTKELFKEVYISYTQGQYRAAIVMLWTTIVCDIIYKLQYSKDFYNDKEAETKLSEIERKINQQNNKSQWENDIIDYISKAPFKLINDIEKDDLETLHKKRHLCAHPIINDNNILFKPTKEMTRSLIRIALEGVLLKSPLLINEYKSRILEDIEKRKNDFNIDDKFDKETFENYIENKYFRHLREEQILNLFKLLWKLVFYPPEDRAKDNISINFHLLEYIYNKNTLKCIENIKDEPDYYSYDDKEQNSKLFFIYFIILHYKEIYNLLSASTKAILKQEINNFPNCIPFYFILEQDFSGYINILKDKFDNRTTDWENGGDIENFSFPRLNFFSKKLKEQADENKKLCEYLQLCIYFYKNGRSYREVDILFNCFIRSNIMDFNEDNLKEIMLLKYESNSQITNNWHTTDYNNILMEAYIKQNFKKENLGNAQLEQLFINLSEMLKI